MELLSAFLILIFIGAVVWNSVVKARVLWLLSRRAIETGTLRGFWGDFFQHCTEGQYTFVLALGIAIPLFFVLLLVVPLISLGRGMIARS